MEHKFAIYCKSYVGDIDRIEQLIKSVRKHNVVNIPFYVSCPAQDFSKFRQLPLELHELLKDEDIVGKGYDQDLVTQQIVKAQFWKTGLAKNYMMIDSDSYFIKNFTYADFITDKGTGIYIPYTVCHQQKELWTYVSRKCREDEAFSRAHRQDPEGFKAIRKRVQNIFQRPGVALDFGPGPVIWSAIVWEALEKFLQKYQGLSLERAFTNIPSEFTWYGEFLLFSQAIPLVPIEPPFKFFHHASQYYDYKVAGIREEEIAENYLGIVMQSNWNAPRWY